ncbi:MAG: hypothetical protein IT306_04860 [Chloroflexi bacterium]|nr:hypothetical protein [Chloroflexota bacterium]
MQRQQPQPEAQNRIVSPRFSQQVIQRIDAWAILLTLLMIVLLAVPGPVLAEARWAGAGSLGSPTDHPRAPHDAIL